MNNKPTRRTIAGLSKRSLSIALAFLLVSLIAGVYFAFNPFPAGPDIDVAANSADNLPLARSTSSETNSLYVGQGYFIVTGPEGTKILPPVARSVDVSGNERLYVGLGNFLEISPQGSKLLAPGAQSVVASGSARLYVGLGYTLETSP